MREGRKQTKEKANNNGSKGNIRASERSLYAKCGGPKRENVGRLRG